MVYFVPWVETRKENLSKLICNKVGLTEIVSVVKIKGLNDVKKLTRIRKNNIIPSSQKSLLLILLDW